MYTCLWQFNIVFYSHPKINIIYFHYEIAKWHIINESLWHFYVDGWSLSEWAENIMSLSCQQAIQYISMEIVEVRQHGHNSNWRSINNQESYLVIFLGSFKQILEAEIARQCSQEMTAWTSQSASLPNSQTASQTTTAKKQNPAIYPEIKQSASVAASHTIEIIDKSHARHRQPLHYNTQVLNPCWTFTIKMRILLMVEVFGEQLLRMKGDVSRGRVFFAWRRQLRCSQV